LDCRVSSASPISTADDEDGVASDDKDDAPDDSSATEDVERVGRFMLSDGDGICFGEKKRVRGRGLASFGLSKTESERIDEVMVTTGDCIVVVNQFNE